MKSVKSNVRDDIPAHTNPCSIWKDSTIILPRKRFWERYPRVKTAHEACGSDFTQNKSQAQPSSHPGI